MDKANIQDILPLTPMQEGMLFHAQAEPGSPAYFEQTVFPIEGELNPEDVRFAWDEILRRHAVLRSNFVADKGPKPMQIVWKQRPVEWQSEDWSDDPDQENKLRSYLETDRKRGFDLLRDPLMRVALFRFGPHEWRMVFSHHHILMDGWSAGLIRQEWMQLLMSQQQGKTAELGPSPDYRKYLEWLKSRHEVEDLGLFRAYLSGLDSVAEIPGTPLPASGYRPAQGRFEWSERLTQDFEAAAATLRVTPGQLLQALWGLLLSRWNRTDDLAFGLVVSGREAAVPGMERMVGLFINTLPVRVRIETGMGIGVLASRLREDAQRLQPASYLSLARIQNLTAAGSGLIRHILVFDNFVQAEGENLPLKMGEPEIFEHTNYDLTLSVIPGHAWRFDISYNANRYAETDIATLYRSLKHLATQVSAQPNIGLDALETCHPEDRERALTFNPASRPASYSGIPSFYQAAKGPEGKENEWGMVRYAGKSYDVFDLREGLSGCLYQIEENIVPGTSTVAILCAHSIDYLRALLACQFGGHTFLPLDPKLPVARLREMLTDSGAGLILITSSEQQKLIRSLETEIPALVLEKDSTDHPYISDNDQEIPAYLIYTSGSTGKPKGVKVSNEAVAGRLAGLAALFGKNQEMRGLQLTNPAFDVSIVDTFLPLWAGGMLIIPTDEQAQDFQALWMLISEEKVSDLFITPGFFLALLQEMPEGLTVDLKDLWLAGESLEPALFRTIRKRFPELRIHNCYGPTEFTVYATVEQNIQEYDRNVIGKPLPNSRAYLIDHKGKMLPPGVPGELCLAGAGLAMGYHNRPELTAERFVPDLLGEGRMYRSGDLARWLPDGRLEFLGRIDRQVKIRGNRVELGEIEARLNAIPEIGMAAVNLHEGQLVAYLPVSAPSDSAIRQVLPEQLPDYMIPDRLIRLERIPLNPNGKIDRKALPTPEKLQVESGTAPEGEKEQLLAGLWQSVLQGDEPTRESGFFRAGGDSIRAMQLVGRLRKEGYKLELRDIFAWPALREMALRMRSLEESATSVAAPGSYPLAPVQRWFFGQMPTDTHHFNQSVWLQAPEALTETRLREALLKLISAHPALRTAFPKDDQQKVFPVPDSAPLTLCEADFDLGTWQAGFDLRRPPLFKAAWWPAQPDRILLCAHHLVVDGVSWRLILDDLILALQGEEILPETVSYAEWSRSVESWGRKKSLLNPSDTPKVSLICPKGTHQDLHKLEISLSLPEIEKAASDYRIALPSLLLASVMQAWEAWTGSSGDPVWIEGHGRQLLADQHDISRSVGWFTSMGAFAFDDFSEDDQETQLWRFENARVAFERELPYMLTRNNAGEFQLPPLVFNYLGKLETEREGWRMELGNAGPEVAPLAPAMFALYCNFRASGSELTLDLSYDSTLWNAADMDGFTRAFREELRKLCETPEALPAVPAGFTMPVRDLADYLRLCADFSLDPMEVEDLLPMSPMQDNLYFHHRMEAVGHAYHEQVSYALTGPLNPTAFRDAWLWLAQRHAALRSGPVLDTEGSKLLIFRETKVDIEIFDLTELDERSQFLQLESDREADRQKGFGKFLFRPWRLRLFRLSAERYEVLLSYHHIILDGWSLATLFGEFLQKYRQWVQGDGAEPMPATRLSDYGGWLMSQDRTAALGDWKARLSGIESATPFPVYAHTAGGTARRALRKGLAERETIALKAAAAKWGVSLNTIVQAAWGLFLQRIHRQSASVFGAVTSGRPEGLPGSQEMVGLFINTLPVCVESRPGDRISDFLSRLQDWQMSARTQEFLPLSEIQEQTAPGSALVDHVMIFENYPIESALNALNDPGLDLHFEFSSVFEETSYPFDITVYPEAKLEIEFTYLPDHVEDEMVEGALQSLLHLLRECAKGENRPISSLSLTSPGAEKAIHERLEGEKKPVSADWRKAFADAVRSNPDKVAIRQEDKAFSYAQLAEEAASFAAYLSGQGLKPGERIALYMPYSPEAVICILGAALCGVCYVPLRLDQPEKRSRFMIRDSEVALFVYAGDLDWDPGITSIAFGSWEKNKDHVPGNIPPDAPAYVIYTSGSTGTPKGVEIPVRALNDYVFTVRDMFGHGPNDAVAAFSSLAFDSSVEELFVPLISGQTLNLAPDNLDAAGLLRTIREQKVTWFACTPQVLSYVNRHLDDWSHLRLVTVGGEELKPGHITAIPPHVEIWNGYGPTEATVCVTYGRVRNASESHVIGRSMANHYLRILDAELRPVPPGFEGELCVGGPGLALGYLNRPEESEKAFIPDPFAPGERLYRTGDRVRMLPDGRISFLGRIDAQVQIRGFRVEPGEVQAAMERHPEVSAAVVLPRQHASGEAFLCAYYVSEKEVDATEFRDFLQADFPAYMIPEAFLRIDHIPLNANGKLHVKALPEPGHGRRQAFEAPQEGLESVIAECWQEVLQGGAVSRNDNFFEIGGHSLKATLLVALLEKRLNLRVSLRAIFEHPVLSEFSDYVGAQQPQESRRIDPAPEREMYPLTPAQRRMYVLHHMDPGDLTYNMSAAVKYPASLEPERIRNAVTRLMALHESLRTVFYEGDEGPGQRILPMPDIQLTESAMLEQHRDGFAVTFVQDNDPQPEALFRAFVRPFRLDAGPLFRMAVYESPRESLLFFDMHHIIGDGVSMDLLVRDFIRAYEGDEIPLPGLKYRDVAWWLHQHPDYTDASAAYWLERYETLPDPLNLIPDHPESQMESPRAGEYVHVPGGYPLYRLTESALARGISPLSYLLLAYRLLLRACTGQADTVVGIPAAGRTLPGLESVIGTFVNTLPLRETLQGELTVAESLRNIHADLLNAQENQDYPFEELISALALERETGRHSLVETMLTYEPEVHAVPHIGGLPIEPLILPAEGLHFNLSLEVRPGDMAGLEDRPEAQELEFHFHYHAGLFDESTIAAMAKGFIRLLNQVLESPEAELDSLGILDSEEAHQMSLLGMGEKYPEPRSFLEKFEEVVIRQTESSAVKSGADRISYGALNLRANQLARKLRALGMGPERRVAILIPPSIEMVIAVWGVLKSGAAYVPIDTTHPTARRNLILQESGAEILLIRNQSPEELPGGISSIDVAAYPDWQEDGSNPNYAHKPEDLAYIIFTSGSTGRPKGVMIERRSLDDYVDAIHRLTRITEADKLLSFSTLAFDSSVEEIFSPLCRGAGLVLAPDNKDLGKIPDILREADITLFCCSPQALAFLNSEMQDYGSLRMITVGGEALKPEHFDRIGQQVEIWNGYGPTEATVCVTYGRVEPGKPITIGRPMDNHKALVLDPAGHLLPPGIPGELWVAGPGLARGYLNQPEETARRFRLDARHGNMRMYGTGDKVRWNPQGKLEFLGRVDTQVQIRGYRVEPEEIASAAMQIPGISRAVCLVKGEGSDAQLCLFIVSSDEISIAEIEKALSHSLPSYMVPTQILDLEEIPLTATGKVDGRALLAQLPDAVSGAEKVGPRNEAEQRMSDLWAEILHIDPPGIDDHFFRLGGHSLSATRFTARLRSRFGYLIPLREVFARPTIRQLAEYLAETGVSGARRIQKGPEMPDYPLSHAQKRLWIHMQRYPADTSYNMFTGVRLIGNLQPDAFREAWMALLQRHESLRTVFVEREGSPRQRIRKADSPSFEFRDMRNQPDSEGDQVLRALREVTFDPANGPLIRLLLLQTGEKEFLLGIVMHHILGDGWSLNVLYRDLMELYAAQKEGRPAALPELDIQYKDYAFDQLQMLNGEAGERLRDWWQAHLPADIRPISLPQRTDQAPDKAGTHGFRLSAELTARLKALAEAEEASLYMVLLNCVRLHLSAVSGQLHITTGTDIAGRENAQLEDQVGFYLNLLPISKSIQPQYSFRDELRELKPLLLGAYAHQAYPFDKMTEEFLPTHYDGHHPFFDVLVMLNNVTEEVPQRYAGLDLQDWDAGNEDWGEAKYDLSVLFVEDGDAITGEWEYRQTLFDANLITRLADGFMKAVEALTQAPDQPLKELLTWHTAEPVTFSQENVFTDDISEDF